MKTIIIIDDEKDARITLSQHISRYPALRLIGECTHGREAVEKINAQKPDLIFLDIHLPGLNGYQVVQQLVHLPVIVVTSAYENYALKAFDYDAVDFLLKPFTAERFALAVAKALAFIPANTSG